MKALRTSALSGAFFACWMSPLIAQTTHQVDVNPDLTFSPAVLTIDAGDTVTWTNRGGLHNVRADDGSFRCANGCDGSGGDGSPSDAGWSFSLTFPVGGDNPYYCEVHGAAGAIGMAGIVTVVEADDDDGGDDGGGDGDGDGDGDDSDDDGGGGGPDPDGEPDDEDETGADEETTPPAIPSEPAPPALPKSFDSGFEISAFADWDLRSCSACQLEVGRLETGQQLAIGPTMSSEGATEFRGWLAGSSELELTLSRETERGWSAIAVSATDREVESIRHLAAPGRYRWTVRAGARGSGSFQLLHESRGESENRLVQTSEARLRGGLGAEAVYVAGSSATDYLVDLLPAPVRNYAVSFNIRFGPELDLRGRRPHVLRLRHEGRLIVRLKLLRAARGDGVRLAASTRVGDTWSERGTVHLRSDDWRRVTLVWSAASDPDVNDGSLELRRGGGALWRLDGLANHGQRVSEVWFGQVDGGGRSEGALYLDDFVSDWVF